MASNYNHYKKRERITTLRVCYNSATKFKEQRRKTLIPNAKLQGLRVEMTLE